MSIVKIDDEPLKDIHKAKSVMVRLSTRMQAIEPT